MGSISDEDIEKVREASDVVAVIGEYVPVKQKGRDYWCCCPLHNENTPSMHIDPSGQFWHCFGCGEGGNVFSFIMKMEDMSFPEAVRKLAERAHIDIVEQGSSKPRVTTNRKERLKQVCGETAAFYHEQLMRGKGEGNDKARAYLSGRDLGGSLPKEWKLGFAPGRGMLVRHLSSKGFKPDEMVDANVALTDRGGKLKDRFYDRVMFPIFDVAGDCIAFGGRIMGDGQPKYLNSQETPIFHKSQVLFGLDKAKSAMATTGTAIVCEGYTDVIMMHKAGVKNAVATLGTALTRQHIRILSRHAKNRIVYLFDGDAAGQRAADRALQFIDEEMFDSAHAKTELYAVTLPDNLDPADFVVQRGAEALQACIDGAEPLLEYGLRRRLEGVDMRNVQSRMTHFQSALEVLAPIKNTLIARHYAVQVGGRMRVSEDESLKALAACKVPEARRDSGSAEPARKVQPVQDDPGLQRAKRVSRDVTLPTQSDGLTADEVARRKNERRLLCLVATEPRLGMDFAGALVGTNWHAPSNATLASVILDVLTANPNATSSQLLEQAIAAYPDAGSLLTAADPVVGQDVDQLAAWLVDELAIGDLQETIETMKIETADAERAGDPDAGLMRRSLMGLQTDLQHRRMSHRMGQ